MKKNLLLANAVCIARVCLLPVIFLLPFSFLQANNFSATNGNNAGAGSLRQAIIDANNYNMNVSALSGGTYLLRVEAEDGSVSLERVMVPW